MAHLEASLWETKQIKSIQSLCVNDIFKDKLKKKKSIHLVEDTIKMSRKPGVKSNQASLYIFIIFPKWKGK